MKKKGMKKRKDRQRKGETEKEIERTYAQLGSVPLSLPGGNHICCVDALLVPTLLWGLQVHSCLASVACFQ
jgi:hypothetical protein